MGGSHKKISPNFYRRKEKYVTKIIDNRKDINNLKEQITKLLKEVYDSLEVLKHMRSYKRMKNCISNPSFNLSICSINHVSKACLPISI